MTALRRTTAALRRLEAARARMDTRDQALARRQRTRQLIELGGLVVKSGLVARADDDRAVILGALLELAEALNAPGLGTLARRTRWRERGQAALRQDPDA
ncbi:MULTISPECIES: conjugal transfer protein TraD [Methylorubrum]|nr:conjugal transfer protein TraD [Methylorubrum extorquens]MBL7405192.1 conjugal transfer protein TraD [Escherichia coli]MCP1546685.1 hypothetical protein [Methylorubrum extorquens]MCP1592022.1 hypothetical protein [Methylorubrum extorquens]